MKKILISGLGGSFFPYFNDQLKKLYDLYYVDSNEQLKYIYPEYNFFHLPSVSDPNYLICLEKIINQNNIDVYLPLIDEEIIDVINYFSDKIIVLAPNLEFVKLCLNKYDLMLKLKELNISNINSYKADNYSQEIDYPIFLKPISGRGSRGIFKISNKSQYESYFNLYSQYKKSDIIVQQNIIGQEYTVGVLVNNLGDLIVINSKRVLNKKGITQMAVTENNELINSTVKDLISKMTVTGPFNIQLYITAKNEVKIFEINPRFSTTTIMSYAARIDEVTLFLKYFNVKYELDLIQPAEGINLFRRWESLFFKT